MEADLVPEPKGYELPAAVKAHHHVLNVQVRANLHVHSALRDVGLRSTHTAVGRRDNRRVAKQEDGGGGRWRR